MGELEATRRFLDARRGLTHARTHTLPRYNSLPLGLTLWAAWAADAQRPLLSAICFSLALNCKQTALYAAVSSSVDG